MESTIIKLYAHNRPIREISRNLEINRSTVRKTLGKNNIKIRNSRDSLISMGHIKEKKKFNVESKEKAYLFGLVMGDLTPVKKSNYTLKLITHTTHPLFGDLLLKSFKEYGITNYKLTKKEEQYRFQSHICLESFNFLINSKENRIPNWIDKENFFHFLAGYIDADGSILVRKTGEYFQFVVRLFSQKLERLIKIKEILQDNGYFVSMHKNHSKGDTSTHNGKIFRYNKDYYVIEICRKNEVLKLLNILPIRHKEKIAKVNLIYKINKSKKVKYKDIEKPVKQLSSLIKQTVMQKKAINLSRINLHGL
ncbi:hypothetical protein HOF78_01040 [Candidatus Woesearchaeota archaeon]|nr:hypothetical protein [Candidatus Woesearchaeota archaeon]MBT6045028.1 hypothetical protein [Candidatus Woesearchaeota archaeon]